MPALHQQTPHQAETVEPRIYVACLAAYSNGSLYGRWIDATQDAEDIQTEIAAMLAASPIPNAEEWAIHDYEGFEGAELAEYSAIETVVRLAAFVSEHGKLGGKLLMHFGVDLEDAEAAFENYAGQYKSLADFAQELTEETAEISQTLACYIEHVDLATALSVEEPVVTRVLLCVRATFRGHRLRCAHRETVTERDGSDAGNEHLLALFRCFCFRGVSHGGHRAQKTRTSSKPSSIVNTSPFNSMSRAIAP